MIKNYLKVAVRSLLRRKGYTLINMFGLAIGMAVCLLIVLFIESEVSYDSFQQKGKDIYRVVLDRKYPTRSTAYSMIPLSIGESIKREYPEVLQSTRLFDFTGTGTFLLKIGDKMFEEKHVLMADSNFFSVFTGKMLQGDAATALQKPNTVVLNETTAKKYFGSAANAIGKSITPDNDTHFFVSAVCKDWPENSHFTFNMLISSITFEFIKQPNYTNFSAHTYLLLRPGSSPDALEAKLPHIIDKYVSGAIAKNFNMTYEQFLTSGNGYHYYLQPLTKIHLISDLEGELSPNGSIKAVYTFSIIAIFILIIACINFINLSTARSVERAKEVGIRKTFGSEKKSLIAQFLLESALISLCSIFIAFVLIAVLLPLFNKVSGKELSISYFLTAARIILLFSFATIVGLIAGLYPAFVLSSFNPIVVLKGKFKSNKYGMALRNGLVVFQFSISVILIICTIIVNQQMHFMLGDKLGFRKDHVIEVQNADQVGKQTQAFKNELLKIPGVQSVSGSSSFPGQGNFFGINWQAEGAKESMTGRSAIVDDQFAAFMNIPVKEGRFFSKEFLTDSLAVVLNEKAVEELQLKNPVGKRLTTPENGFNAANGSSYFYTIVGVVKDFHYQSLHQKIAPLVFVNTTKFGGNPAVAAIRINAGNFKAALKAIETSWKQFVPQRPFHYDFLDRSLEDMYNTEQRTQRIFTIFSVLAIFIACIGLLGLAAYATQMRMREISIRKILGASVSSILSMLSKDFLRLIFISFVVAFPLAWWGMHTWLQNFAYQVTISWWIFLLAGSIAALIALLTISFQAVKAAIANPVKSLRTE
ncbi:MAG TPA: ABC transporter permease [Chitinophagaceae bacterium]|nr:ABC transporter permease [Chitinophagaceae bacterium]